MLSEEEKQAIEILKQEPDFSLSYYKREKAIDIVLNLIDKQQEEIEELKSFINLGNLEEMYILLNAKTSECEDIRNERDRALKVRDKIREKIKELEEELSATDKDSLLVIHKLENKIDVLEELLGDE